MKKKKKKFKRKIYFHQKNKHDLHNVISITNLGLVKLIKIQTTCAIPFA